MDRLVSLRNSLPTEALYRPDTALESIIATVQADRDKLSKQKRLFYFMDDPELSIAQIHGAIKEFKQRTKATYLVVAIDLATQVSDFMNSGKGENLAQSMEKAMNKLNVIAKKEMIHFILVAQFNRDADNTKVMKLSDIDALRPSLNNIKNGHAIAERSRAVLGLFRPKYYADRYLVEGEAAAEAEYLSDILEVQVLKQSNGATPRLKYSYEGEYFRCTPYKEDIVDPGSAAVELNF
jgi:replicative DNA helicase